MNRAFVFIVFSLLPISIIAQKDNKYQHVDEVMMKIPDSLTYTSHDIARYINLKFTSEKKKVRAAFFWITQNITYNYTDRYNFKNEFPNSTNRILSLKKGICKDYVNLLKEILDETGIKTYVVDGYTRNGKQLSYNPHSWCVNFIDSAWHFTDPTFGAGFVRNEQFIKKRNDNFFMKSPKSFIKHHIPFDPLWQLLNHPISKKDFVNGRTKPLIKTEFFNFKDTLDDYERQNKLEKLKSAYQRVEKNGIESYLDYDILVHYQQQIDNLLKRNAENEFSKALINYNLAITCFNEYIDYKNNYFRPYKNDEAIRQMLDLIEEKFELSKDLLNKINSPDLIQNKYIANQKKLIDHNLSDVKKKKENLSKYLKIAKQYREKLSIQKKTNSD